MSKKVIKKRDESVGATALPIQIGWREWVSMPDLGIKRIKVKVDTGARTSSLHAINIHYVKKHGRTIVRFEVHPLQRDTSTVVHAEAPLIEERYVTNSGGKKTLRPVIETPIHIMGEIISAEITLISRDEMGFRMLLGRQAIRNHFLVNPGKSFLGRTSKRIEKTHKEKSSKTKKHVSKKHT